jgi:hypothetical protein
LGTIFGSGSSVLVDVVDGRSILNGSAARLYGGGCLHPGPIVFALSRFTGDDSLTLIGHSLADIAGRARSLVIHTTAEMRSPQFACRAVLH